MDVNESTAEGSEPRGTRPPLLRVLVEAGVATEEELRLAFAEGMGGGERFGAVVLRHGWLDEVGLARALAQQWSLAYLEDGAEVDHDCTALLSAAVGQQLRACPVSSGDGRLLVAVAEPTEERFASVRAATDAEPSFAVVAPATLERLLTQATDAANEAQSVAAEARAARAAEDEQSESSLRWLERELEAATAQLVAVRERIGQLVASDQRSERELAECQVEVAELRRAHTADEERIHALETRLGQQQQRVAAARAKLAEANRTLDE